VRLGGRRVPVDRPRARGVGGHEVPLQAYGHFAADDQLSQPMLERMLAGVATRRHARVAEGQRAREVDQPLGGVAPVREAGTRRY
jgi:hypothetical protein